MKASWIVVFSRLLMLFTILFFAQPASAQHAGHGGAPAPAPKQDSRVAVRVSQPEQAKMGLRTARVETSPVNLVIRTVGSVVSDQSREAHIHTRLNGWIERIFVDAIGKAVQKGDPLFELYSPDLVSTQEEYLAARSGGSAGREIARAALERLQAWNVPESEIKRLQASRKSKRTIAFNSPVNGVVVNKTAIQGMYITPEMELYHIADLSRIWILVTLYESDFASIKKGDLATVTFPYDETRTLRAPIAYTYPEVDVATRTSKARIEIENKKQDLKPGMFVNVEIAKSLGDSITVPEDAVIDTGIRKIVFVKKTATEFEPREIKVGPRFDGKISVLSGLQTGAEVVVSAHFLLDAESKVQAALRSGKSEPQGHEDHGTGK